VDLGIDLRYYILLIRRRLIYILVPFVIVLAAFTAIALVLPPVYRSTGTILVEAQQIPDSLVRATTPASSSAGERVGVIIQRVMTRANILRIAEKFKLFQVEGGPANEAQVVDSMHKAVTVEPVTDEVDGLRSRSGSTMAFTVSFDHKDPGTAVAVAKELVSLFLRENVRSRTIRAAEATNFLRQESGKLKSQVSGIENQIAQFKERHRDSLPDRLPLNIAGLDRAKTTLQETKKELESIQAERRLLEIQLAAARSGLSLTNAPYSLQGGRLTPAQELEQLQAELIEKSAIYDRAHPDIISLQRKIALLKSQYGIETSREQVNRRLSELKIQLKDAKSKYSSQHPDVKNLTSEIKKVEAQLAAMPPGAAQGGAMVDPIYAHVQAQIEAADDRTKSLRGQEQSLQNRITDLEAIVTETPMIERGLSGLTRDYQNAVRKYDEIKAKEMEAQLTENLEEDKKAERLTLLDPPTLPDGPIKPNRLKFIAYGLALAIAAGGAGFLFIESIDSSVHGASGYRTMFKTSPYIVIPYIATTAELRQRQMYVTGFLVSGVVLVMTGLVAFHLYIKPIDSLFVKLVSRLS
jgi:protein tyrosine kinase modulator